MTEAEVSPKAATTNRVRDYRALEREYVTGDMSLRELCRRHGVTAHSGVVAQAKKNDWVGKRDAYRSQKTKRAISRLAEGAADREAEVRDAAIEAIDEAITRFRADLRATKRVVLADGSITEEPVLLIGPRDLALLIDRFQVLFGRPNTISEGRDLTASVTSEVPIQVLQQIVALTRGLAPPGPDHSSGLPDHRDKRSD